MFCNDFQMFGSRSNICPISGIAIVVIELLCIISVADIAPALAANCVVASAIGHEGGSIPIGLMIAFLFMVSWVERMTCYCRTGSTFDGSRKICWDRI